MGGAVSAGANNDELIDNLLEADYINSSDVERVFRAVDRGHYFTAEYKERAYRDLAWKCGNLHISAPCIYSRVMENLKLGPGMSFLNLGSGTGYLSTMAGLLLGSYGTNHGIEIHEDVLNYSTSKLDEFILTSSAIDEYEFCEPKFVNGNCLYLGNCARQYDRVYCGAACPENHETYMKNLIKVGGILVMPINDQLLQICRTSDTNWESKAILPVSFATLISGKIYDCVEPLKMPEAVPLSLQDICRFAVRSTLRHIIDIEHPELKKPPRIPWKQRIRKRTLRRLVIPIFNSNSDSEEDQTSHQATTSVEEAQFLMDVSNVQTCRSIMEWSQILQGTSAQVLGAIEAQCTPETISHKNMLVESQSKDDLMEDDNNFVMPEENSNENIFEEMSDEEFLSDIEELHSILKKAEASTSIINCVHNNDDGGEKKTDESLLELSEGESRTKGEKFSCGILEDMEPDKEISSESEEDVDADIDIDDETPCLEDDLYSSSEDPYPIYISENITKQKKSDMADNSVPVQIINYTTYMKEKIKLLPLPRTLKYFLNLNREL